MIVPQPDESTHGVQQRGPDAKQAQADPPRDLVLFVFESEEATSWMTEHAIQEGWHAELHLAAHRDSPELNRITSQMQEDGLSVVKTRWADSWPTTPGTTAAV